MDKSLKDAIREAGSISELGRKLGISQQAISQWKRAPIDKIILIEAKTGVGRERLRPELFKGFRRVEELA